MNGIRIKILLSLIGLLSIFSSCSNVAPKGIQGERFEYELIRDDLCQDREGNLYFRTIDRSASPDPIDPDRYLWYRYNEYLYVDSLAGDRMITILVDLNVVVDRETFHKLDGIMYPEVDTVPTPLLAFVYADKNSRYLLYQVADGGMLHKINRID